MNIEMSQIDVRTGSDDRDGRLILVDGELAAVLVKLSDAMHGDRCGEWNVEVMFHRIERPTTTFATEFEARKWIEARMTRPA